MTSNQDTRYTIISADAHAGLPCEEYRPYRESRYLGAFAAFLPLLALAVLHARRAKRGAAQIANQATPVVGSLPRQPR